MGFPIMPGITYKRTDLKKLNRKIGQLIVIEPNPECLEFTGMIALVDKDSVWWVIHEWDLTKGETKDGIKY